MHLSFTEKKNVRKNFGKLKETISIPNLIEVQKKSYKQFLTPLDLSKDKVELNLSNNSIGKKAKDIMGLLPKNPNMKIIL